MKTVIHKIRTTSICLITAAAIAAPSAGYARWFSAPKPVVKKLTQTVRTGTSHLQDNAGDIADKLTEIHAQIEDNRPLINALKNGQMMQQLTEIVQYLNESQQDYQAFTENGVYLLRQDIQDLVGAVSSISDMLNLDSKLNDQLHKAAALVDKMPVTFLFALAKSGIDKRLQDILARLIQLSDDLVLVATLPLERNVYLYPGEYKDSLCPLVNDQQTRVQLAVLNARIDANVWAIDTVSDLIPEDLNVSAMVVGGGGATVSKFPPQYIFKAMKTILSAIKLRVGNYKSIAESMCSAA